MDDSLAQDLVSMWQSELTAMAADREVREAWAALVALWAQSSHAALSNFAPDVSRGSPEPLKPPRSPAIAPASQPGLDEVERLGRRIAELEQRLAEFMAAGRRADGPGGAEGGV